MASPVREPYVEENALQSLVVTMTRAGSLAVQGRGEIKGLTGSGLAQKQSHNKPALSQ